MIQEYSVHIVDNVQGTSVLFRILSVSSSSADVWLRVQESEICSTL